jgi:signal peptidase
MLTNNFDKKSKSAGLFLALSALLLIAALLFGRLLDGAGSYVYFLNYKPYTVTTGSMQPGYAVNSFVIIKRGKIAGVKVGDVIAFRAAALGGEIALHRVTEVTDKGVYTKGDDNKKADNQLITSREYVGTAVFHTNIFANYIGKLQNPAGLAAFLLFPIAGTGFLIFALDVFVKRKAYPNAARL